jgi:hypothetical protein
MDTIDRIVIDGGMQVIPQTTNDKTSPGPEPNTKNQSKMKKKVTKFGLIDIHTTIAKDPDSLNVHTFEVEILTELTDHYIVKYLRSLRGTGAVHTLSKSVKKVCVYDIYEKESYFKFL